MASTPERAGATNGGAANSDAAKSDIALGRRALWSTLSNYAGQFVTLGVGFLLTPFVLHHLGATEYGLWVLVGSLAGYGSILEFGIAGAVTRYAAAHRARGEQEALQQLVASALTLYLLAALLALALSAVAAALAPTLFSFEPGAGARLSALVLLAAIGVSLTIPSAITTALLRGFYRYDLLNLISIVGTLLAALATVAILLAGGGIEAMLVASIVISAGMQVPAVLLVKRTAPELRLEWRMISRSRMREIAAFSSAIFVGDVSNQLQAKTDEIVIGVFLPLAAVTPYALALRLSDAAQSLARQFVSVLLPLASAFDATDDRDRLRALYLMSTRLSLAVFVPLGCVLAVLAEPLLHLWVGPTYAEAAPIVVTLVLVGLVRASQWPAGFVLQGMARHRPLAIVALAAGVANLLLSVVLVQVFGVMGVALGTLLPTVAEGLGFVVPYAVRVVGVSWRRAVGEAFAPALLPAGPALVWLLWARQHWPEPNLVVVGAVGGVSVLLYAAGYWRFGASVYERRLYGGLLAGAVSTMRSGRLPARGEGEERPRQDAGERGGVRAQRPSA